MSLNDESGFKRITKSFDWDGEEITPCYMCVSGKGCDPLNDCWLLEAYLKLSDYEDSGYSPSEVLSLIQWRDDIMPFVRKVLNGISNERINELIRADKENRVVVLPWDKYGFGDEVMYDAVRKADYMFEATGDSEVNKFIFTAIMEKCCRDGKGWVRQDGESE